MPRVQQLHVYRIPCLFVVCSNRSFYNDEAHQERVAKTRGRPVEDKWIGQRIAEPDIDLGALASPQLYEPLMERLFEAGTLDVYFTPALMKKSRPSVVVTALCAPGAVNALTQACFQESTTIGVRWTAYQRQRLPREMVTLETSLGMLTSKVSRLGVRVMTVTPEFDEVKRIAREKGLAVREALDQARAEGRRLMT